MCGQLDGTMNGPHVNIVLVIIDTLRYDFVGANGNDWINTPSMDRLAAESWVFDRCFSASYPTIPHRTDVMTGRCGDSKQVFNSWVPLRFDVVALPQVLAGAGYCTQLIHDTPHLINGGHNFDWPFHAWTFIRGAEVDRPWINDPEVSLPSNWKPERLFKFIDEKAFLHGGYNPLITYARANRKRERLEDWNAAKLFITASQWLKDNASRDNFFLWIDCFDPHEPWDVPPEFATIYDETPNYDGRIDPRLFGVSDLRKVPAAVREQVKNRVKSLYAAKVSWVDKWLGVFLDTLEETGLTSRTAVILTSDHGTNLGERYRFHKSFPVREQEGHVPLFIRVPGYSKGRSGIFVQPQDIFASVLGIAGVETPAKIDSQNALKLAERVKVSCEPREIAISGRPTHSWHEPEQPVFTVFGKEHYLELAAKTGVCRLTRYGSLRNIASSHLSIVHELREAAIKELERRNTDPAIIEWLLSEGESRLPKICFPGPEGYSPYWRRLYNTW